MLFNLYIYNKHGDCIYYTEWNRWRPCKSPEEEQRLMYGMLFSLRSFCQKASPAPVLAFQTYLTSRYKLHYFESGTSARFVLLTSPEIPDMNAQLRALYQHYADYCLKNPLYTPKAPIECELFTIHLQKLFAPYVR
mmetsp:Transcript_692/g.1612  ORF Transcript_692/g.1612 Transcript_692/m.1612 type:complete len:136 (-) Transcript_692:65-472(-)